MSLEILFYGQQELGDNFEFDAEDLFMRTRLTGCEYDREVIKRLEQGEYLDNGGFIDRFGYKLPRMFLSTGAQILLSVYHNPDKIVNGVELGHNALYRLVQLCKVGHVLLTPEPAHISCVDEVEPEIDVVCRGVRYTDIFEFGRYMMEDAPYDGV